MDRGLKAPLSPNEEVTLRRVGYGIAKPNELIARDVGRLTSLALIDRKGERLVLTQLGRERLATMPGAYRAWASPEERIADLAALMKKPL